VDSLFTLVNQLATRSQVTEVAAPKWLVHRHGLAPLAARAGLAAYRPDLVRATVEWARIEQDLPLIVNALQSAGIRACALKGVSYAKTLYPSPAERPMSDIDLMVPPRDAARAREALATIGFVPFERTSVLHHAIALVRGEVALDLHWNIIAPGRARVDLEAVWSRVTGDGLAHLDLADALTFHLIHLARNRLRLPLINVVDASRLLERASRMDALERARSWGLERPVANALRFCEELRDGCVPTGFTRDDIALVVQGSPAHKVSFDLQMAGSPRQFVARIAQVGANKLRDLVRRDQ